MRVLISLLFSMIFTVSCGFNNRFEVPSEINGNISVTPVSGTVTVRHEVVVSAEMTSLFESTCTAQIDANVPPLPEPVRSESIKLCVAKATQEFIASILALINQSGGQ